VQSIRNLAEMQPAIIAPGHAAPFDLTAEMVRDFDARVQQQDDFFKELIADRDTDMGLDPAWVQIYPYQAIAVRGRPVALELRVRNHRSTDRDLEIALCLPEQWHSTPARVNLKVPAGGTKVASVEMTVPLDWGGPNARRAIAADVIADGVYLGQIAEAVVDVRSADSAQSRTLPDERR
jgi:hypothetical protein